MPAIASIILLTLFTGVDAAINCQGITTTFCNAVDIECNKYTQDNAWNVNTGTIELTDDIVCNQAAHGLFHARAGDVLTIIGNGHTIDVSGCSVNEKCRVISLHDTANFTASNLTIKGGQAPTGGGLWVGESAQLSLTDVTFVDNHAYETNDNNGKGGAIWIWTRSDILNLTTVRFQNNAAVNGGSAMFTESSVIIDDCEALTQDGAFAGTVSHPACATSPPTPRATTGDESMLPFDVSIRDDGCSGEWSLVDDVLCYGVVQEAYFKALRPQWARANEWATSPFQLRVDTESILNTCPPSMWPIWQHGGAYTGIKGLDPSDSPDLNTVGWQAMPECEQKCRVDGVHTWSNKPQSYNCLPHYHRFDQAPPQTMLFWYGTYGTLDDQGDMKKWVSWNENKVPSESSYYKQFPHLVAERKQVYDPRILSGQDYFVFPVKPSGASLCQKTNCGPGYHLQYETPANKNDIASPNDLIARCTKCPGTATTTLSWGRRVCDQLNCTNGEYTNGNTCQPCPSGHYCPPTSADPPLPCPVGNWCPAKTEGPLACPAGTSTETGSSLVSTACQPCPEGDYCESGQGKLRCDPGYYCPPGSTNATGLGRMAELLAGGCLLADATRTPTQCTVNVADLRAKIRASGTCGGDIVVNCTM